MRERESISKYFKIKFEIFIINNLHCETAGHASDRLARSDLFIPQ